MGDRAAQPLAAGQVVTVFRSRLRPEAIDEYEPRAAEMFALAHTMPGLVDVKSFTAESQRAWREHPDHRLAQQAGRDLFYAEYSIQVCDCTRVRTFTSGRDAPVAGESRPDGVQPPVG
jgi:heme-degrading monooxygenase HmoA